ncbi:hypothetical protein B7R21_19210 [Subtercola boreus]|uniref:ABC transporter domain-containing protein n=1 Tax=Subtercola boreus TaxID=120213 RepID=A0A3E0VA51_9MICO|nr:sugar ABC transporter ATP-binding protein [Subtercola boreus]RFA06644.1 hypothetical protein B7R21_19210 [Subtercola boreus]
MFPTTETAADALSIRSLSKTFAGLTVLNDVSLTIAPGEVHALLGQNGSGKSTLIKCLAGVHRPDPGSSIQVNGRQLPQTFPPSESSRFGLAFVHQDLGLIGDMTVAENLAIGTGFERSGPLINWRSQKARAIEILDSFGLLISPNAFVRDLPVTARTLLAIARAFQPRREANATPLSVLILDEPTAALPDNDAELLFEAIARVTAAGVGVGYVTHRLEEVFRIANRASILRDGVLTGTFLVSEMTRRSLFTAIVGERAATELNTTDTNEKVQRKIGDAPQPVVLRAVELTGVRVRDASLTVKLGEILGIAGLAGSGRSELARLLFGSQKLTSGSRSINDIAIAPASPKAAMRAGIALVPEDRRRDGCILDMSIAENITLAKIRTTSIGFLNLSAEKTQVKQAISALDIRPRDPSRQLGTLSGGNQQKVVLAKWLARNPKLLILDEPVQGVDVGAKADIFALLREAAASGAAILVIDSDFDNLANLCDRVAILRNGQIVSELEGQRLTTENMSQATFGVDDETDLVSVDQFEEKP